MKRRRYTLGKHKRRIKKAGNRIPTARRNTVRNSSTGPVPPAQEEKRELVVYKDVFTIIYFEIIAKSCSTFIYKSNGYDLDTEQEKIKKQL